ncbi:MAG: carbohydrate ABC transporter permease [Eubacteriales bacterium]|nr:carbohydrate ABC transporter permease [Eubacteriales bacterium]
MKSKLIRRMHRLSAALVLIVVSLAIVFPLLWMALTSFKSEIQLFSIPPIVLPAPWTLENYATVLGSGSFATYFGNSVMIAVATVVISTLLAIPAAYGMARTHSCTSKMAAGLIIFMRMVPGITFCIPYFMLMKNLGLNNSHWALIVMYVPSQLLMSIWLMRNFFLTFPIELEDAADIDGAPLLKKIFLVVAPVSLPTISTAVLFAFLQSWNEYLLATTMIRSPELWTMPMGMAAYTGAFRVYWGELMTNATLFTIPVILFTIFAQKGLISGLTMGAVKS